jgi:hypothetical protein
MQTNRINKLSRSIHFFTGIAMVLCIGFTGPAEAANREEIKKIVVEEANRVGISPSLALAVAKVESDFQGRVLSNKGARGVMQIMPKTAWDLYKVEKDDLWNPRLNVQLGVDFLDSLMQRYDGRWDLALSHYNGGSKVGKMPNAKVIPYTQGYVDKVLRWERRYSDQKQVWNKGSKKNNRRRIQRTRQRQDWNVASIRDNQRRIHRPHPVRWQTTWTEPEYDGEVFVGDDFAGRYDRNDRLDDFDDKIEVRRRRARRSLDDFSFFSFRNEG